MMTRTLPAALVLMAACRVGVPPCEGTVKVVDASQWRCDSSNGATIANVLIENGTSQPITLSNLVVSGDGFALVTSGDTVVPPASDVCAPSSAAIAVRVNLNGTGTLTARRSDRSEPLTISLSGMCGAGRFSVPSDLNLGPIAFFTGYREQSVARSTLTLRNASLRPIEVKSVRIEAVDGNPDELCLGTGIAGSCSTPAPTLAAGESIDVPLRIDPLTVGNKTFRVTFTTDETFDSQHVTTIRAVSVEQPCRYSVSPARINFANAAPTAGVPVQIHNLDAAPGAACLLTGLTLSAPFAVQSSVTVPTRIEPGATLDVPVLFKPELSTPTTDSTLHGEIANAASFDIALHGARALACLTISPSDFDFGTLAIGCQKRQTVAIYNTCSAPVTIEPATSNGADFTAAAFVQVTLQPGESTSGRAVFTPSHFGQVNGALILHTTMATLPVDYVLTLRGSGDGVTRANDLFRQNVRPKGDLVFVLDDSPSMATHQDALRDQVRQFLSSEHLECLDLHIGVARGGSTVPGVFTSSFVTTAYDPHATDEVVANLLASAPTASNTQQLFLAAAQSFSSSINPGFHRANTPASVVFISDGEDSSAMPPGDLVSLLPTDTFVTAILSPAVPVPACTVDSLSSPTTRFSQALAAFGPARIDVRNICSAAWFDSVSFNGECFRLSFFLTATPSAFPLDVKLDGQSLAEVDSSGDPVWHYDAVSNAIVFVQGREPQGGQTLQISYTVTSCAP